SLCSDRSCRKLRSKLRRCEICYTLRRHICLPIKRRDTTSFGKRCCDSRATAKLYLSHCGWLRSTAQRQCQSTRTNTSCVKSPTKADFDSHAACGNYFI